MTLALPQPAPRGAQWIDLDEAARRSGRSKGHLARICGEKWLAAGLAESRRDTDRGGRPRWFIREDADPSIARVAQPENLPCDLRTLTADQRAELSHRKRILDNWLSARAGGAKLGFAEAQVTAQFLQHLDLDEGRKLSRATLFNWHRDYRANGLAGLIDSRWIPRKDAQTEEPEQGFFEKLRAYWLTPNKISKRSAYDSACLWADQNGIVRPSLRSACRYLQSIPAAIRIRYRGGEEDYVNNAEPYIERDYSGLASNELWVSDHHELDLFVDCGEGEFRRPWLTAFMDMRSRKIVGHHLFTHDPNTDTILIALKRGVESHGVPLGAYFDNGKDFDSYALQGQTKLQRRRCKVRVDAHRMGGVLGALGCTVQHAQPYHGQSKPIERWFGTLADRFCRPYRSYCGNKPENRPESWTLEGAPTLAELNDALAQWIDTDYHQAIHSGDGMDGQCPAIAWAEHLDVKRVAPEGLLDLLLQKKSRPTRVTQNGVTHDGLHYGQYDSALREHLGGEVYLRVDPADLTRVSVWDAQDRFICVARGNPRVPANACAEDLRQAMRLKRTARRADKLERSTRMHLAEDLPDTMTRAAAARHRRENPTPASPPPPASIQPIRTGYEDQLPALQRALEADQLRPAVGCEGISLQQAAAALRQSSPQRDESAADLRGMADALRLSPQSPSSAAESFASLRKVFSEDQP